MERNGQNFPLFLKNVIDSMPTSPKRKSDGIPRGLKAVLDRGQGLHKRKNVGSVDTSKQEADKPSAD